MNEIGNRFSLRGLFWYVSSLAAPLAILGQHYRGTLTLSKGAELSLIGLVGALLGWGIGLASLVSSTRFSATISGAEWRHLVKPERGMPSFVRRRSVASFRSTGRSQGVSPLSIPGCPICQMIRYHTVVALPSAIAPENGGQARFDFSQARKEQKSIYPNQGYSHVPQSLVR